MARTSPVEFVRQVQVERAKIVWPTPRETMMTTILVVIMAVVLSAFFFILDTGLSALVKVLLTFVAKA